MPIAPKVKKYFWDIDPKKATPKSHPDYYIKRILETGDSKAYDWLKRVFGVKQIAKTARKAHLSSKSKNYWGQIFDFK